MADALPDLPELPQIPICIKDGFGVDEPVLATVIYRRGVWAAVEMPGERGCLLVHAPTGARVALDARQVMTSDDAIGLVRVLADVDPDFGAELAFGERPLGGPSEALKEAAARWYLGGVDG